MAGADTMRASADSASNAHDTAAAQDSAVEDTTSGPGRKFARKTHECHETLEMTSDGFSDMSDFVVAGGHVVEFTCTDHDPFVDTCAKFFASFHVK
jgi:hypothetical protein